MENCSVVYGHLELQSVQGRQSFTQLLPQNAIFTAMGAVQLGLHMDAWTEGSLKPVPAFLQLHLRALSTSPSQQTSKLHLKDSGSTESYTLSGCCFQLSGLHLCWFQLESFSSPSLTPLLPTQEPCALEISRSPTPTLCPVIHACSSEAPPPCPCQEHAMWTVELFVLRIFLVLEMNALYIP